MILTISILKDDFLLQQEINREAARLKNLGVKPKTAYFRSQKVISKIQNTSVININPKYDKDIDPREIAHDIAGKQRFFITTRKN